jgi:hypothetical protein
MGDDRGAHARIPEFPQVIGDGRHRLVSTLADEELADLIRHIDELVKRHRLPFCLKCAADA